MNTGQTESRAFDCERSCRAGDLVLAALTTNLLVALGDSPELVRKSQQASVQRSTRFTPAV
jgi:hypothetical protein